MRRCQERHDSERGNEQHNREADGEFPGRRHVQAFLLSGFDVFGVPKYQPLFGDTVRGTESDSASRALGRRRTHGRPRGPRQLSD